MPARSLFTRRLRSRSRQPLGSRIMFLRRVAVASVLALTASFGVTAGAGAAPSTEPGRYLVQFRTGADVTAEMRAVEAAGIRPSHSYRYAFPGFAAALNAGQLRAMQANPNVVSVEADTTVSVSGTQSPATWGLDRVDQRALPLTSSYSYPDVSNTVTVYVIDTGVRADHVELAGRMNAGYSAIVDGQGSNDCNGHGTHVAATAAGTTYGIAKTAQITPVRVLGCDGSGTLSQVIAGVDWVIGNHAAGAPAVANLSLGSGVSTAVDTAMTNLVNDGVTVVVAAGNSAADACQSSPARVPAVVTVAASDAADRQASFSNFGPCIDLYAPGVSITSAGISSSTATATMSGTSMASPHVAGAAALLLGDQPALTPAQVSSALTGNATSNVITRITRGTANRLLYVEPSSTDPAPTVVAPSAPTSVTATAGNKSATVTWTRGSDGGSSLLSQTVHVYQGSTKLGTVSVSGSASSVTISGLRVKTTYTFTVSATNVVGSSPESAMSNAVTVR